MSLLQNLNRSRSNTSHKIKAQSRKSTLFKWSFLLLILIGFSELFAYKVSAGEQGWFSSQEKQVSNISSVDIVNLGSSRVSAAVDLNQLTELVSEETNDSLNSINLAGGNISLLHSYLALKRLLEKYPEKLEDTVILLELPDGLPPIFGTWANTTDGWNGKWTEVDKNPQFISAALSRAEAKQLWLSDTDLETKFIISMRWVTQRSHLLSGKEYIREKITTKVKKTPKKIIPKRLVVKSQETSDLASEGGISTDQRRFESLNLLMEQSGVTMLKEQDPFDAWDHSLINDFFQLAEENDLKIVFYHMPQSSHFKAAFSTTMREQDRVTFGEMAKGWNASIIQPDWNSQSDDFPDGLHLAKSRRSDFTEALANQLIIWWREENTKAL